MELNDIAKKRLINQHIAGKGFKTVKELVSWMGAMQAQDYAMAKWAIGIRLLGSTDEMVEEAINRAEIVRTHVLRPTWHFVSADDIRWMLALKTSNVKSVINSDKRKWDSDNKVYIKCLKLIEKSLEENRFMTRPEIMEVLNKEHIRTDDLRASHIMLHAESEGIVCNGPMRGKNYTYTLLEERIPQKRSLTQDEALATLATKFFNSHGPATINDFIWWSGLSVAKAKAGLEMIRQNLYSESFNNTTYWFSDKIISNNKNIPFVHLIPAYDEYLISYKDRSAAMMPEIAKKAISSNGLFKPVIVKNGKVVGIWKRTIAKGQLVIEPDIFSKAKTINKSEIKQAAEYFGRFLGLPVIL